MTELDGPADVLVVGATGGREHAAGIELCNGDEHRVAFTHGNPGTEQIGQSLGWLTVDQVVDQVDPDKVKLAWIGPEAPLVEGVGDRLRAKGVAVFGPGAEGARLEGSKAWFADFAKAAGLPQPDYRVVRSFEEAQVYMHGRGPRSYVVKADGLAGGKGALLLDTQSEVEQTVQDMLSGNLFGEAGKTIVFQHRLNIRGPEASAYYLFDGTGNFSLIGIARDYKRIGVGDTGKNTGGMGAYAPLEFDTPRYREQVLEIGDKTARYLKKLGIDYRGIFFAGLMIDVGDDDEVKVLEGNVRYGDPEAQVVLPGLRPRGIDFFEMTRDVANGSMDRSLHGDALGDNQEANTVFCAAADGYPDNPRKGDVIKGLDREYEGVTVYQAGTRRDEQGRIITNGGRVLYVRGQGETMTEAGNHALAALGQHAIHFAGMQYRTDIAGHLRAA